MFDLKIKLPKVITYFDTEKDYRDHDGYNQSKIKDWINMTPFEWRDRYVFGTNPFVTTPAVDMGSAVDILLTEGQEVFDKKIYLSKIDTPPTGNTFKLVEALFDEFQKLDEPPSDFDSIEFATVFGNAYDEAGIKSPKKETWLENFKKEGNEASTYFIEKLASSSGKIIITQSQMRDVESTVEALKKHPISEWLFTTTFDTLDIEIRTQFGVAYEYNGRVYKALFDFIVINKKNKTIRGIDLKTNHSPNIFGHFGYLKNRYYFQDGIYSMALEAMISEGGEFEGYTIEELFSFLVIDNKGIFEPSMWTIKVSEGNPWEGFYTSRGSFYKGIEETIDEIEWHISTNNFRTTKEIHDSDNHIKMTL